MIREMIREEISNLSNCNTSIPPRNQSLQCNGTSESTYPPTVLPTHTPQPTPVPGPQCNGTSADEPARSCNEIYDCDPTAPSGLYWVNTNTGPVQVYCEMEANNCGNTTGRWMRVAYINMTNVNNTCPQGLNYTVDSSTRMCTHSHTGFSHCSSVTFPTHGVPYTRVCGRA